MKKGIKSIYTAAAAALISLSLGVSAFAQTTDVSGVKASATQSATDVKADASENKEKTTYIFWDNKKGDDKADGSSSEKAVKSLDRVLSIINGEDAENADDADKTASSEKTAKTESNASSKKDAASDKTVKTDGAGKAGEGQNVSDEEDIKFVVVNCNTTELTAKESEFITKNKISVISMSDYELILKEEAEQSKTEENAGDSDKKDEGADSDDAVKDDSSEATGGETGSDEKTDGTDGTSTDATSAKNNTSDSTAAEQTGTNGADTKAEGSDVKTDANDDSGSKTDAANVENAENNGTENANNTTDADGNVQGDDAANSLRTSIKVRSFRTLNNMLISTAAVDQENTDNSETADNSETQNLSLNADNSTMTASIDGEDTETADNNAISLFALPGRDLVGGGSKPVKTETQGQSGTAASSNTSGSSKSNTSTNNNSGSKSSSQTASNTENNNLSLTGGGVTSGNVTSGKNDSVNTGDTTNAMPIAAACAAAAAGAVIIALKRTERK